MRIIITNIICVRFHPRTGILAESKTDHIPVFLELPKTVNSGLCVSQGEMGGCLGGHSLLNFHTKHFTSIILFHFHNIPRQPCLLSHFNSCELRLREV